MKSIIVNKITREIYINGRKAGVGWTEKMDKDIAKFGKKIALAVTKCMFNKMCEKHDLEAFEMRRLRTTLSTTFNV